MLILPLINCRLLYFRLKLLNNNWMLNHDWHFPRRLCCLPLYCHPVSLGQMLFQKWRVAFDRLSQDCVRYYEPLKWRHARCREKRFFCLKNKLISTKRLGVTLIGLEDKSSNFKCFNIRWPFSEPTIGISSMLFSFRYSSSSDFMYWRWWKHWDWSEFVDRSKLFNFINVLSSIMISAIWFPLRFRTWSGITKYFRKLCLCLKYVPGDFSFFQCEINSRHWVYWNSNP